jgi:hypothetical protein|tara:strand:- start:49 stop:273 length:225 start_codon:yes stop_codon:yes gene_type:complete
MQKKNPKNLGNKAPKIVPVTKLGKQNINSSLKGNNGIDKEVVATSVSEIMRQKITPPNIPNSLFDRVVIFSIAS